MVPFQRDEQLDATASRHLSVDLSADPGCDCTKADSGSAGTGNFGGYNTRTHFTARHNSGLIAECFG
jgi:hypothetical protein